MTLSEVLSLIDFSEIGNDVANNPKAVLKQDGVDAAKEGNLEALTWIAQMYAVGSPYINANPKLAFTICSYCVDNECDYSCNLLGDMYEVGCGVTKSISKAFEVWEKGAVLGSSTCMYKLAGKNRDRRAYHESHPLSKSEEMKWFVKAADKDYIPACITVGLEYIRGRDICPDCKIGVEYLRKAFKAGDTSFMDMLDNEIQIKSHEMMRGNEFCAKEYMILCEFKNEVDNYLEE